MLLRFKTHSNLQRNIQSAMIEAQIFMDIKKSSDIIKESFEDEQNSFSVQENLKTKGSHKQPFYYKNRW